MERDRNERNDKKEGEENDLDIDQFFDIMGNAVRRQILKMLTTGPRSIKELDREINVSRQAILKQINDLKELGLIDVREDRKQGQSRRGPSPHVYNIRKYFSFVFETNPLCFNPQLFELEDSELAEMERELEGLQQDEGTFHQAFRQVLELGQEMEELRERYRETFIKRNRMISLVRDLIEDNVDQTEEKEVLYNLLKVPEMAINGFMLDDIREMMNIRPDFLQTVLDNLVNKFKILEKDARGVYRLRHR